MNIAFTQNIPEVFDPIHLGLAGLVCIMLLILIFKKSSSTSADTTSNSSNNSTTPVPQLEMADENGALHLLSVLQRDGRLIDFVREDVSQYSDQEIGAAARVVHKGLKTAVESHFTITPIQLEAEGATIQVAKEFDTQSIQLVGNVTGDGPFSGVLVHQGWQVTESQLPHISNQKNQKILAPAQVEI